VRELPDERTIEHDRHRDERETDDNPCPQFGFAVLFVCVHRVHHRPTIAKLVEVAAPGMHARRGQRLEGIVP